MLKVGCIGTGATGKTTTLKLLEPRVKEAYVPGVMRQVLQELSVGSEGAQRDMSDELTWRLQKTGFDRKIEQDRNHKHGLFDRTLLDHFVYCMLWARSSIDDSTCKSMMILVKENLESYDRLFYFPICEWSAPLDPIRENSYASRIAWDFMARGLLEDLGFMNRYDEVPDDEPTSRAAYLALLMRES